MTREPMDALEPSEAAVLDAALDCLVAAEAAMRPAVPAALMARVAAAGRAEVAGRVRDEASSEAAPTGRQGPPAGPDHRRRRPGAEADRQALSATARRRAHRAPSMRPALPMIAAMAASLAVGLYVGATGMAPVRTIDMAADDDVMIDAIVVADAVLFADDAPF